MDEGTARRLAAEVSEAEGLPEPQEFTWQDELIVLPREGRRDGTAQPKVWLFPDSGDAYDASQCADAIRSGDVLMVPSEGSAAVLREAWPVLQNEPGCPEFVTDGLHGTYTAFSVFLPGYGWENAEPEFVRSGKLAGTLMRRMAGLAG